jgi:3-phosphoshikimate 1-carboxyvinyltransferase
MKTNVRHEQLMVRADGKLRGTIRVPGDKSISHRSVMLGAIAKGVTQIRGWLAAGDTEATLSTIQALGVQVERHDANTLTIHGGELHETEQPLDLKNAGTGIRLIAGIMVGQSFPSVLDGSTQLRSRPMKRITTPLEMMGAKIQATEGRAPMSIEPASLKGITYDMPVASGQVKSAVLLAGLFADSPTTVIEPGPSRDHTEVMLSACGVAVSKIDNAITVQPTSELQPLDLTVPGDFSSAAFLITAALIVPDSDLTITGVNLNATRTGLLDVLTEMGGDITVTETGLEGGEPVGDIRVKTSDLHGIEIGGDVVVRMIDEFPVLMVATLCSAGETIVRDAKELRVKETDRIAVMAKELRKMGVKIEEREDGFKVVGQHSLTGATVDGHDDHRIAMSLTIAGLMAEGETIVMDAACAGDSFPGFAETLIDAGANIIV